MRTVRLFALLLVAAAASARGETIALLAGTTDLTQIRTAGGAASTDAVNAGALATALGARAAEAAPIAEREKYDRLAREIRLFRAEAKLKVDNQAISLGMAEAAEKAAAVMEAALTNLVTGIVSSGIAIGAAAGYASSWTGVGVISGVATSVTPGSRVSEISLAVKAESTRLDALGTQLAAAIGEVDRRFVPSSVTAPISKTVLAANELRLACSRMVTDFSGVSALAPSVKAVDLECRQVTDTTAAKLQALLGAIQQLEATRSRLKIQLDSMRAVVIRHGG